MLHKAKRVLIMGAGGRDFHVFNTCFRDDARFEVVTFTAAQIPHIDKRTYPPELAGRHYPAGIPIHSEADLEGIIQQHSIDEVVFAYSDVSYEFLESIRQRVVGAGASFDTFDETRTLLPSSKPCVAVCAVRTGCGKSPLARYLASSLRELGLRPGIIRHPMPYGNLRQQMVQRFAELNDLQKHHCTIEEMEEYEPHLRQGSVVFAGVDYEKVVAAAENEADVLLWDGGNNDTPFVRPDLLVTLLDPLRVGDELGYFPGQWNFQQADVLVIAKIDEATTEQLSELRANVATHNPRARVVEGALSIELDSPSAVRGKRALVVEDGPTITHGGLSHGAGYLAAKRVGAEIVDPRPYAVGEIADAYAKYAHIGEVLPALGYTQAQLTDLEATVQRTPCDVVVIATPVDLSRVMKIETPAARVTYTFEERGEPRLPKILGELLKEAAVDK